MKKVYIVLSYSGTLLSRLIKLYTRDEFSHVSISLDKGLKSMYSFGRLYAYFPFIGGFVQESPSFGTFRRFKNTTTKIYSIDLSDDDYRKIKDRIEAFIQNKKVYRFNFLGILAAAVNYRLKRKNCYYCAEFVKHVLESSGIELDLPEIVKPEDFQGIGNEVVYNDRLSEYSVL